MRTALALCALALPIPNSLVVAAPPQGSFAGSTVCRGCHPNVWLNFHRNAHFKSIPIGKDPPERTGCEGCHGPGAAHVKALGGADTIRAFSLLEPRQILDACLTCHVDNIPRTNIRRSSHTLAGFVCTNCHSIHKSPEPKYLLANKQSELCYTCHSNVRAQFAMPFKHRVNEGAVQCTDCHNPHGAAAPTWRAGLRPRMVKHAQVNEEPCLKCHSDKRGPFAFEHPAVRVDGCESCHSPHGSMNPRLLRRPLVFTVCLECHNGAGTFGRQGDGIRRQSASHNMTDPRYQNCTACHVRIHGSNSSPLFFR
ncbi:MAG: DmsE family decaheme c-type cytochrome [bacterium]|nr:DmsE family decaheme c-type cytochrome [bacterium]